MDDDCFQDEFIRLYIEFKKNYETNYYKAYLQWI